MTAIAVLALITLFIALIIAILAIGTNDHSDKNTRPFADPGTEQDVQNEYPVTPLMQGTGQKP